MGTMSMKEIVASIASQADHLKWVAEVCGPLAFSAEKLKYEDWKKVSHRLYLCVSEYDGRYNYVAELAVEITGKAITSLAEKITALPSRQTRVALDDAKGELKLCHRWFNDLHQYLSAKEGTIGWLPHSARVHLISRFAQEVAVPWSVCRGSSWTHVFSDLAEVRFPTDRWAADEWVNSLCRQVDKKK